MKKIFVIYIFILCISVLTFCACSKTSKEISNMQDEENFQEYTENDEEEILEEYVAFDEEDELIQKVNNNSFPVSDTPQTPATEKLSKELLNAAQYRNVQLVRELIKKGANVNFKDEYGETPLHYAAKKRNAEIAKILIENGANVNAKTKYKATPLVYSLDQLSHFIYYNDGDIEIEKLLINNGADINVRSESLLHDDTKQGLTPLDIAAGIANKELIQLLLNKGAKAENIYTAAGIGDLELVKKFLPKITKKEMGYVLYYATKNGHKDIAEYLIKQGTKMDDYSFMDIMFTNNTDIIKLLIENGANVNINAYGTSLIKSAIENKNLTITKLLLDKGAQITEEDFKYAAQYGNAEIMKELFTKNIKVNLDDLLSIAIENGNKSVIDFLVSKGANTNNLRAAIALGDKQKVQKYLEQGKFFILTRRDDNGKKMQSFFEYKQSCNDINPELGETSIERKSLLYFAVINNQPEIVKLLVQNGEKISDGTESIVCVVDEVISVDNNYSSTLELAVERNYTEIVKFLLENGIYVNPENAMGRTPLEYAKTEEMKQLLLKYGAEKGSGFERRYE